MDDEDERIRVAVREAEEKRAKEEGEKEGKMRKVIQEQAEHRNMQVGKASATKLCFNNNRI